MKCTTCHSLALFQEPLTSRIAHDWVTERIAARAMSVETPVVVGPDTGILRRTVVMTFLRLESGTEHLCCSLSVGLRS